MDSPSYHADLAAEPPHNSSPESSGLHWALPALLLFCSGGCALVFQTAWLREFRLVFGGSTPATAAVLSIFMAGLGLGNALLGGIAERHPRPFRLYGILEAVIAATAALSPLLIMASRKLYIAAGGQESLGMTGATLLRLLLAMLVMIIPTLCMGGTLPAIAKAVTTQRDRARRGAAFFYGMNTLGAVFGTLLSTFFLAEFLGTRRTLWCAATINALLAFVAIRTDWSHQEADRESTDEAPSGGVDAEQSTSSRPSPDSPPEANRLAPPVLVYLAAALVGFAFFLMELVWYRMLGPLLGGTTFTFGLILAAALFGIGLGGATYAALSRRFVPSLTWFAVTCCLEAICIAFPFAWGDDLAFLAYRMRTAGAESGFAGVAFNWGLVALLVVGPAAWISGIQFSLLIALLGQGGAGIGRHVGRTCAWNTVGAIAGSLAGGFGLLPWLSAPGAWRLVVVLLLLLGLVALLADFRRPAARRFRRLLVPVASAALAAYLIAFPGPSGIWRHSGIGASRSEPPLFDRRQLHEWCNLFNRHVVWQRDGIESAIALHAEDSLSLIVNGKSDGNALHDAGTQIMLGLLGPLLHPDPRSAIVVGLGTGESAGWMAQVPSLETVEVVELESSVDEMARRCAPLNFQVLQHPKVRRIYNDAREVLLTTPTQYDLIVSEPSNPYRAGVAALFTHEFYQSSAARLKPQGIFVQWLQGYEISRETVEIVLATLHETFDHVQIWQGGMADLLLVCTREPLLLDAEVLKTRLASEPFRAGLLYAWAADDLEGLVARHIANESIVRRLAEGAGVVNSDDLNRVEYGFVRSLGVESTPFWIELREEAARTNQHRPKLRGEVDWKRVADVAHDVYFWPRNSLVGSASVPQTGVGTDRLSSLASYAAWGNIDAVVRSQFYAQPRGFLETVASAHAAIYQNNPQFTVWLEQISRWPTATTEKMLRFLWSCRQQQLELAQDQFLELMLSLRKDPFAFPTLVTETLEWGLDLAHRDQEFARRLYPELREPFATYALNQLRVVALFSLMEELELAHQVEILEMIEPYPFWIRELLIRRSDIYQRANHPLAAQAKRDLDAFRAGR